MSSLLRNVTNSLWHAFVALQNDPTAAVVNKSRLKVLTANIGCLLDVYGVERGLDHYQSSGVLSFDHYRNYLQDEVFDVLPSEPLTLVQMRNYEASIEEVVIIMHYIVFNSIFFLTNSEFLLYSLDRCVGSFAVANIFRIRSNPSIPMATRPDRNHRRPSK